MAKSKIDFNLLKESGQGATLKRNKTEETKAPKKKKDPNYQRKELSKLPCRLVAAHEDLRGRCGTRWDLSNYIYIALEEKLERDGQNVEDFDRDVIHKIGG